MAIRVSVGLCVCLLILMHLHQEGLPVVPEHLDDLVSTLSGMEGDTVTVKDLAEGIKAWSLEREKEESTSWGRRGLTERGELELEKGCNREIERVRCREQRSPSILG